MAARGRGQRGKLRERGRDKGKRGGPPFAEKMPRHERMSIRDAGKRGEKEHMNPRTSLAVPGTDPAAAKRGGEEVGHSRRALRGAEERLVNAEKVEDNNENN